jgi:arylsulfatase A-like enzyme
MGQTIHAIRRGDWKLVHNSPQEPAELYNLAEDPREQNNLVTREPKVYNALMAALQVRIQIAGRVPWQAP